MSNPSKAKGTLAETAVVKWVRDNGFPGADRQPLRGNRDAGDIALCPGIVLEIKNHAGPASLGQPTALQLDAWMAQAEAERVNAGAAHCPLIVKRAGTADVGRWWAYITAGTFSALLRAQDVPPDPDAPICLSVASMAALLRSAGYGTELTEGA